MYMCMYVCLYVYMYVCMKAYNIYSSIIYVSHANTYCVQLSAIDWLKANELHLIIYN